MKKKKENCFCSGNSIVRSEGEFTIVVIRNSFNIKKDLPYVMWGSIYMNGNNFATALQPYLPGVGVTTQIVGENLIFTYTEGPFVDQIIVIAIPTGMMSYPEMLASLNTNYLRTELVYFHNNTQIPGRPVLTLAQNLICQSKPLYLQKVGGLGSKGNEQITPLTRQLPNNSTPDVLELSLRHQEIKPDTFWVHQFAYLLIANKKPLVYAWQVIINEVINMNEEKMSLSEIEKKSELK